MTKKKRTVPHEEGLLEDFKDLKFAEAYLNDLLWDIHTVEGQELFLLTLKRVAKAHGMTHVADLSQIQRESLHQEIAQYALANAGTPEDLDPELEKAGLILLKKVK